MAFHQLLIPQAAGFAQLVFPVLLESRFPHGLAETVFQFAGWSWTFVISALPFDLFPKNFSSTSALKCSPRPECISLGSSVTFLSYSFPSKKLGVEQT